jgi:hypothetical protein
MIRPDALVSSELIAVECAGTVDRIDNRHRTVR